MLHQDLTKFRRACDDLWPHVHRITVSLEHLRQINLVYGPGPEIMDWFWARGFYTAGILYGEPKSVWVGHSQGSGGRLNSPTEVCFHPSAGQDAMLFKLTFG